MGCACKKGNKKVNTVSDAKVNALNQTIEDVKVNNMARMVNYEGQLVPHNSIPQGSLFVNGVWYSSVETMPEDVREMYNEFSGGLDSNLNTSNSNTK